MKSWIVAPGADAPALVDSPVPVPAEGMVLVRVSACGLNFADLLMLKGQYQDTPPRPYVPGMEFSGTIAGFGAGVAGAAMGLHLGQRVAGFGGQGGLAEFACLPADRLVPLPDAMSFAQGAAFQIAYGTSHLALGHRARLIPGETLLVTGAAGGVGLTAVELGARMGARVIALARGAEKRQIAARYGAGITLDSAAPDLKEQLRAIGADVVYDTVGGDLFRPCLGALRPEGRYLAIGFASGTVPQVPANHLLVRNLSVIGLYWGGYLAFRPDILRAGLAELLVLHAQAPLGLHISHELPFDALPEGLALLSERKATGKVVLTLGQEAARTKGAA